MSANRSGSGSGITTDADTNARSSNTEPSGEPIAPTEPAATHRARTSARETNRITTRLAALTNARGIG
jgi:hypothetical protein